MYRWITGGLAVLSVMPAIAAAQAVHPLASQGPLTNGAYSQLSGARELDDGRVLVLEGGDKRLWVVDPRRGTRTIAGATGSGRLEYDSPWLFAPAGASTYVEDFAQRKILQFNAAGAPVAAWFKDSLFGRSYARTAPRFAGADNSGRLFFEVPTVVIDPIAGARGVDSSAIVRLGVPSGRVDTIGFIRLPPGSTVASGGRPGEGLSIQTGVAGRYAPYPTWAPTPDGGAVIVYPQPYRVVWIAPDGRRLVGETVPVAPIALTPAELSAVQQGANTVGAGMTGGGQPAAPAEPPSSTPRTKPAIVRASARIDWQGQVWVRRSTAATDNRVLYDVFDRQGRLVARYQLPERTSLIGFGTGKVFVARATDDGQRLEVLTLR